MIKIPELELGLSESTQKYFDLIYKVYKEFGILLKTNEKIMIKEGIHINGIYRHYKGNYYKIEAIAYNHEDQEPIVIYSKCNQYGIYISIRKEDGSPRINQPFYRNVKEFKQFVNGKRGFWNSILGVRHDMERFKFIKY